MSLKLMYITNDADIAKIAEDSGVEWIFIDLETNGKQERQKGMNTLISDHCIQDVARIKKVLTTAQLGVRVNPIYSGSAREIDEAILGGADIVMLPYFKGPEEVKTFIDYVDGRSKVCLLAETSGAVSSIDSILSVGGIDYIHVGLNDLHLCYKMKFMFELLADGTVEYLCDKFRRAGIPYGFGGVARIGKGELPAENIIAEHYRLGSGMALLSRSFYGGDKVKDIEAISAVFHKGIKEIREYEAQIANRTPEFFEANHKIVCEKVAAIKKD
jgi:hypothetical protein